MSESRIILKFTNSDEHTTAVTRKRSELCKRIMEMSPVVDGSLEFMNTAERQSGNSFDVNISLSNSRPGGNSKELELYYLNLSFTDTLNRNPGGSQKRVVAIELRYMDDSCIADVGMPLSRYVTEVPIQ
ncbi:MAG: hypothetical protein JRN68_00110 [Nitrososphaerota archaeon]|nr:hypothetical protein [Nitrososphaerota archaeon]